MDPATFGKSLNRLEKIPWHAVTGSQACRPDHTHAVALHSERSGGLLGCRAVGLCNSQCQSHHGFCSNAAGSSLASTVAAQSASLPVSARKICCLTARICEGCMEKLRSPSPSNNLVMPTSPAI